jgi:Protein of unknown function (DUF551)
MSEWQPISSGPPDMGAYLFLVNGRCLQGFVDATGAYCVQDERSVYRGMRRKPSHWMPLPAPPKDKP